MFQPGKGQMQGINMYCPAMQFCAALDMNLCNTFSLGKPAVASATAIATALSTTNVGTAYLTTAWVADSPYGRPVQCTPSGSVTATVAIFGEDYLGQPMAEQFSWSASAAAVTGKKAFYRVLGMRTSVAGGAVTVNVGTVGSNLGLPFKGSIEWAKEGNPPVLINPSTLFTAWVTPDVTDPATLTTGDTRGQYTCTAALDGLKEFIIGLRADSSLNSNNNGGLHGIRQFNA
jgi:hypothetical protein